MNLKFAVSFFALGATAAVAASPGVTRFLEEIDSISAQTEALVSEKNAELYTRESKTRVRTRLCDSGVAELANRRNLNIVACSRSSSDNFCDLGFLKSCYTKP